MVLRLQLSHKIRDLFVQSHELYEKAAAKRILKDTVTYRYHLPYYTFSKNLKFKL